MKSLNVKKIAVAAVGAAMIGAAFAGAVSVPSSLSSYQFFSNGSPQVKIVVGSAAAASDAVAAANIAAMVGNLAYTSTPVTINGESGLACSGSAGTASCSGGSATVQVTTPGINPASAYQMTTLINSALNANYTGGLTSQSRSSSTSFTTGLNNMISSSYSDSLNAKITPSNTPVLQTTSLNIGGNSISEEEDMYAASTNQFSSITNSIQSNSMGAYYVASFTPSLPICTDNAYNANTSSSSYCDASGNLNLIGDSRNVIQFLGQPWVVESPSNSTAPVLSSDGKGVTQLVLGQESAYSPTLDIGQVVTASNGVKVTLNSITGASGGSGGFYASFNVTATDGTTQIITLNEQASQTVDGLTVHVGKIFPGLTSGVQYAEVSIYSNQITLQNAGQTISGTLNYGNWQSTFQGAMNSNTQGISKIIVYNYNTMNSVVPGSSYSLITNSPLYNLNYIGVTNVSYSQLTFSIVPSMSLRLNTTGCSETATFNAIQITAPSNTLYDSATGDSFSTGYLDYANVGSTIDNSTCGSAYNATVGDIYYQNPSNTAFNINNTASGIQFRYSSSLSNFPTFSYSAPYVGINETTSRTDGSSFTGQIQAYLNVSQNQFTDGIGSTTSDSVFYTDPSGGPVNYSNTAEKQGFITNRGSVISGISSNAVTINYANTLAGVVYTLTPSGVNASSANTANYTLTPGQSQNLGDGYSITLASVGSASSTTTGGNASISGLSGLSASPANAETVVPLNTASTPLVEFDSQASTTQPLIVVGGPAVNTVAASLASQGSVSLNAPGDAVVQEIGNDILVAGYTAADTQSAANALIAWMAQNAASIAH